MTTPDQLYDALTRELASLNAKVDGLGAQVEGLARKMDARDERGHATDRMIGLLEQRDSFFLERLDRLDTKLGETFQRATDDTNGVAERLEASLIQHTHQGDKTTDRFEKELD